MAIPLVKRIHGANSADELRVLSLTGLIGSDSEDTPLERAKELGIKYPVALTAMYGEWSPYLNLNESPALTHAFVVGRSGGVVWRGDPSRDTEEFLDALRSAITAPRARPLPSTVGEELADAVAAYVGGDFAKARKLADKVARRFAKKKGEEAQRVATEAAAVIELIDGTHTDRVAAVDAAWEARDAEGFAVGLRSLRAAFPKSEAADAQRKRLAEAGEFTASVESWSAWIELRDARPPAFPERREKPEARYAKSLEKYLKKNADGPGVDQARAWLERYRADRP